MNWRFAVGILLGTALALAAGVTAPRKETRDLTDPETILQLAQQEMQEAQARNREHAVKAITQKNLLQAEYDRLPAIIRNLEAREAARRQQGDEEETRALAAERERRKASQGSLNAALQSASDTVEAIKTKMRQKQELIRAKTTQAMALQTEWRRTRIEREIDLSYLGRATVDVERAFRDARKKLDAARAQNALLAQIRASVDALQTECDRAKEQGDPDRAQRLQAQCDALATSAAEAFRR